MIGDLPHPIFIMGHLVTMATDINVCDRHGAEVFQYSEYSNTSEYFSKSNHKKTRHPEITSIQKVFRTRQPIHEYSQLVIMNTCEYF